MADGKVTIDTELNNKGLDKGLKDSGSKLKDFAKTAGKVGATAAAAAVSIKAIATGVKEVTEAYKVQKKAETQLESAARNNPYLNDASVKALKNYAGEIQSYSTYGDEELLPFMAKLAAAGRTQEEIFDVMAVAVDMAASGAMSLDSAVSNLNKAYGGLSGELGETIPEIKNLTAEELKNGGATKLLGERYKGIAKDVAETTGSAEKLANAMGDLKEELGAPFEKALSPVRTYFAELISGWANAKKAKREYEEETQKIIQSDDLSSTDFIEQWEKEAEKAKENASKKAKKTLSILTADYSRQLSTTGLNIDTGNPDDFIERGKLLKNIIDSYAESYNMNASNILALIEKYELLDQSQMDVAHSIHEIIKAEDEQAKQIIKNAKEKADAEAKVAEEAKRNQAKQKERDEKAQEHIDSVTKALADQLEAMRVNAELRNEEVDTAEELNAYMSAYVDLVVKSNGLVTENHTVAKNMLDTIKEMAKAEAKKTKSLEEQAKLKEVMKEFYDFLGELQDELSEIDFYKNQIKELEKRKDDAIKLKNIEADEKLKIEKEFAEAKAKLDEKITQLEKEQQRERIDNYISIAKEFADEYANAMNNITRLASEGVEARAYLSTKEAEKMYNDGEIGYEEYQEKLSDIEKESAKQRHKIAMWEWGVQLVQAIANTAQGITKAIAQGGVAGIALGALVGAAGAAQIALITANKPVAPSFATGGIVGGTSYTGDRVQANVNSGEMILTYAQQKRLFDIANGGRTGGNVQVFNSASNDVNVRPEITPEGVRILIRKVVNEDMASGRYNKSYKKMRGGLNGVRLTN